VHNVERHLSLLIVEFRVYGLPANMSMHHFVLNFILETFA